MKIKVIANPTAGRGKVKENLPKVRRVLTRGEGEFEIETTDYPGHATEIASEATRGDWDIIAAMGGDGTVREVLQGTAGVDIPVGIIPSGMGNDVARSLRIPEDITAATQLLQPSYLTDAVDLGLDGNQVFDVLGLGFPVEVMRRTNSVRNRFIRGPAAIFISVLQELSRLRSFQAKVQFDDRAVEKKLIALFIMNTPYTGGGMKLIPSADPHDGKLDLALIEEASRRELITTLPRIYSGAHRNHPKIHVYRAQSIRIQTDTAQPAMIDGDVQNATPIEAQVWPKALKVIVPPE